MHVREIGKREVHSRLWVVLVVAPLLVLVGVWLGLGSSWGTKHAQTLDGLAMRANDENGLVMFDADDGAQADFNADSIWWTSDNTSGDGNPPCLERPQVKAKVTIGLMKVAGPDGGWRQHVTWVRCL